MTEPTAAELVARARALQPLLREHAAETEADRRVADECIAALVEAGLCRPKDLVKVLGQGSLDRPIRVTAHAFSASAAAAITTAGGSVERMPLPFGNGRPPASGNALMNR